VTCSSACAGDLEPDVAATPPLQLRTTNESKRIAGNHKNAGIKINLFGFSKPIEMLSYFLIHDGPSQFSCRGQLDEESAGPAKLVIPAQDWSRSYI